MAAMDIGNMLNTKNAAAAAAAAEAQLQQLAHAQMRGPPDMGSDHKANGQHGDPHMYTTHGLPLHPMANLPNNTHYPSPSHTPQSAQMMHNGYINNAQENAYPQDDLPGGNKSIGEAAIKAYACSTCAKNFARRSDLARHERIHSNDRPHVCEWPGCGKRFIQRSALTVHGRIHTGEKPHLCERCSKPFGDSSSLARHRRIHSGRRDYKCPYANCQKTFTRRTTLTRHQNSHVGTIEEAEAETNAKLATLDHKPQRRSDGGSGFSETASTHSTPSPSERPASISPGHELPPIPNMNRQPSDYGYMPNAPIPPHLRGDFQQASPRSSPGLASPALSNFGNSHHRPSMTSHPNTYGPPQPLEPPANNDHRSGGSVGGSPHMSAVGWGSPQHPGMPSPGPMDSYSYPDPSYGGGHPLYFSGSNIRRPQSTEPDNYEMKPRHLGNEWNTMPVMQ